MITATIQAIAEMFSNFFGWRTEESKTKAESAVIEDKQDLERACKYAEDAFDYTSRYATWLLPKYEERYKNILKKFRRCR